MWCIEVKAKIDIPLIENISEWTNDQFKKFIKSKSTGCAEFKKALEWVENRNFKEAVRDCENQTWLNWLKTNYPKDKCEKIQCGDKITITHGKYEKYALWHYTGIWDLPEEYVGETIKIICHF